MKNPLHKFCGVPNLQRNIKDMFSYGNEGLTLYLVSPEPWSVFHFNWILKITFWIKYLSSPPIIDCA